MAKSRAKAKEKDPDGYRKADMVQQKKRRRQIKEETEAIEAKNQHERQMQADLFKAQARDRKSNASERQSLLKAQESQSKSNTSERKSLLKAIEHETEVYSNERTKLITSSKKSPLPDNDLADDVVVDVPVDVPVDVVDDVADDLGDDLEEGEMVDGDAIISESALPLLVVSPAARVKAINGRVLSLFSPLTRTRAELLGSPNAGYERWNSNEILYPLTRLSHTIVCNMDNDYSLATIGCLVVQAAFETNLPIKPEDGLGKMLKQLGSDVPGTCVGSWSTFLVAAFNCSTPENASRIASTTFIANTTPRSTSVACLGSFVRSVRTGISYRTPRHVSSTSTASRPR
jgi:hypothetical protein